jgi:hypothetical protein
LTPKIFAAIIVRAERFSSRPTTPEKRRAPLSQFHSPIPAATQVTTGTRLAAWSSRRLLLLGGIALVLAGMVFGDIFAVFVLHQNAARVGAQIRMAAHAALAGDSSSVGARFRDVGSFLENRGTKVDTHVHMIDFGYLALLLAIVQPWVAFSEKTKRGIGWMFLAGAWLLPVGVFFIHYVGLAYSPLRAIGWASIFADLGGGCVLLATAAYLAGLSIHFRSPVSVPDGLLELRVNAGQRLLAGGLLLVVLGFAHGAYYAATDLYRHEAQDYEIVSRMAMGSASGDAPGVDAALAEYGQLQGEKAVKIAAHAHIIEFGLLAMILAFFQPYVNLSEKWKLRWVVVLITGSVLLPVCVLFELRFGLFAGALADVGGFMVIVALIAMWVGIVRYTGNLDVGAEGAS